MHSEHRIVTSMLVGLLLLATVAALQGQEVCDGPYQDRAVPAEEIGPLLAAHRKWLAGEPDGQPANLCGADLTGVALAEANLTWANLTKATLTRATLTRATLVGATLNSADLTGADLTDADPSLGQLDLGCSARSHAD